MAGKNGRPIGGTKMNDALKKKIVDLISEGNSIRVAAEACGVHRNTIGNHMEKDPAFKEAMISAEANCEAYHISNIKHHSGSTWQASAWFLERKYPDRYGKQDRVSLDVSKLSDYQLERIAAGEDPRSVLSDVSEQDSESVN